MTADTWLAAAIAAESADALELPQVVWMSDPVTGEESAVGPFDDVVAAARFIEEMESALTDGHPLPTFKVLPLRPFEA